MTGLSGGALVALISWHWWLSLGNYLILASSSVHVHPHAWCYSVRSTTPKLGGSEGSTSSKLQYHNDIGGNKVGGHCQRVVRLSKLKIPSQGFKIRSLFLPIEPNCHPRRSKVTLGIHFRGTLKYHLTRRDAPRRDAPMTAKLESINHRRHDVEKRMKIKEGRERVGEKW